MDLYCADSWTILKEIQLDSSPAKRAVFETKVAVLKIDRAVVNPTSVPS